MLENEELCHKLKKIKSLWNIWYTRGLPPMWSGKIGDISRINRAKDYPLSEAMIKYLKKHPEIRKELQEKMEMDAAAMSKEATGTQWIWRFPLTN
ncbi:MAG: hypothetical protein LUH07_05825 [Lachnospiraceae bacterium]|nr:hypothetical protein [Lachnospiraceae bacterium]